MVTETQSDLQSAGSLLQWLQQPGPSQSKPQVMNSMWSRLQVTGSKFSGLLGGCIRNEAPETQPGSLIRVAGMLSALSPTILALNILLLI